MFARVLILFLCACACINLHAQVGIITTIAGDDIAGFSGDNGPATNAKLYWPSSICLDHSGNIFISDAGNHRIRKIDPLTGIITTVAGTGVSGYNGDNIAATDAKLYLPDGIFTDSIGNLFIADALNNRIRKVTFSTGVITTVAGNGMGGFDGDGGQATDAKIFAPTGLSVDRFGNIYVADLYNYRIRKIEASTGIISTIAGTGISGYSGDHGLAINAQINNPCQPFADSYGNIYFTESGNSILRKVDFSTGIITTVAGTGVQGYSGDGGLAVNAQLDRPYGLFIDSLNNIYIDEWGNGTIRRIDAVTNKISTVAGTGVQGFSGDGGPATDAKLIPDGIWVDKYGSLFIADVDNNRIRKVYNPQLSVNNTTETNNDISVFPNPANDELTIEYHLANNEDAVFEIIDLTGRIVTTKTLKSGKRNEIVDIHVLTPGMYLYRVSQNNMLVSTGKIIKQ